MKLTKNSKELMLFFTDYKHVNNTRQNKRTDDILIEFYKDILNAYNYLKTLKKNGKYFNVTTKKIVTPTQISWPKIFSSNSFPQAVRKHIDETTMTELTYHFSLYGRNIKIHFIVECDNVELKFDLYNKYIDSIIMWLHIINKHSSKQCANTLAVYFYFTSLEKKLPSSNIYILDQIHVNTAFTTTCPKDSEIVIFRKEEWFKVFVHETFHNFGLDFSDMNNNEPHNFILDIFKVKSDVNLFESYTEFWAQISNALFCSFISLKNKNDVDEFLSNAEFFINFEKTFSFFQLVKSLDFMGLTYQDLYLETEKSRLIRLNLYKERTSVLAYYVLKTVLINNYQGFLSWCKNYNVSLLQFKKTSQNQLEFCEFIKKNYKSASMMKHIKETSEFYKKLHKKSKKKKLSYILTTLRMSICELG